MLVNLVIQVRDSRVRERVDGEGQDMCSLVVLGDIVAGVGLELVFGQGSSLGHPKLDM